MPTPITWDEAGKRVFETGVKNGILFVMGDNGAYGKGVAWNGLTSVSESPEGGDANDLWADNMKYATLRSAETYKATIEAYTYPDEFMACDGTATSAAGVYIGQQKRKTFAFCYTTNVGSDSDTDASTDYKLHLVWGLTASPSDRQYQTVNDSPDAITFSWEVTSTPIPVTGYKPVSSITIDSKKASATNLKTLMDKLVGTESAESAIPTPAEVIAMFPAAGA